MHIADGTDKNEYMFVLTLIKKLKNPTGLKQGDL